jgi:hypothetical protein
VPKKAVNIETKITTAPTAPRIACPSRSLPKRSSSTPSISVTAKPPSAENITRQAWIRERSW